MTPRVLPKAAWSVVRRLVAGTLLDGRVLAGGTGLALQMGHRISVDLDLFRPESFDTEPLRRELSGLGALHVQAEGRETLHVLLDGVRLSFLRTEAPFLFPPTEYRGLRVADVRDIAAMKIVAIGGRGSRKDFVDLHAILKSGIDLAAVLQLVRQRFGHTHFNEMHLLKSLVYFEDAEREPMPRMLQRARWGDIRTTIEHEVRRLAP